MKKRNQTNVIKIRGFFFSTKSAGGERLRTHGHGPHRLAQNSKTSRARAAVSIQNPAHSLTRISLPVFLPHFSHRLRPPESQTLTSPATRGEPRLRLLLLCYEQLPCLRGHRPRQALGNSPHFLPHRSGWFQFRFSLSSALDPRGSGWPGLQSERFVPFLCFFFYGSFCDLVLVVVWSEDGV